jgi:2-acylglycerol O-acyltransferase 2
MPTTFHCFNVFEHTDLLEISDDAERKKAVEAHIISCDSADGFPDGSLATKSDIGFVDEALVLAFFSVLTGGPMLWGFLALSMVWCSWSARLAYVATTLVLAFHPLSGDLPATVRAVRVSRLTAALYKYFSYRFVWTDDELQACQDSPAWIGAGGPHGVLPIANLLSMPAMNTFAGRNFVGAGASVVKRTPFLRYMQYFGYIDVSGKSMTRATGNGTCVGMVPDGIAGIFTAAEDVEELKLLRRKGLAKLSLRSGVPLVPAYSVGNTRIFRPIFDSWGIMEALSRKLRVSLFFFVGRFGLPIPKRENITMIVGAPIVPPPVADPAKVEQGAVDAMHARLLQSIEDRFDWHKGALGWGQRKVKFV